MKAKVFVTLKPSVFDPQGQTIADALELTSGSPEQAHALASEVADKLLANPVIESYRIEVDQ